MEYKIEIKKNPEGYSAGTYEYVVTGTEGIVWCDGGYESAKLAREAAKDLIRRLQNDR